jgi:hypothetical protein
MKKIAVYVCLFSSMCCFSPLNASLNLKQETGGFTGIVEDKEKAGEVVNQETIGSEYEVGGFTNMGEITQNRLLSVVKDKEKTRNVVGMCNETQQARERLGWKSVQVGLELRRELRKNINLAWNLLEPIGGVPLGGEYTPERERAAIASLEGHEHELLEALRIIHKIAPIEEANLYGLHFCIARLHYILDGEKALTPEEITVLHEEGYFKNPIGQEWYVPIDKDSNNLNCLSFNIFSSVLDVKCALEEAGLL